MKVLEFQRDLLIGGLKKKEETLGVDLKALIKGLSP